MGQNLEIFPLRDDAIKGASVNLTASNMAWHASSKLSAVNNDSISIKRHDTTLVLTNEIFYVSNKIAGTFHSRVADVSIGEGHISTVINPGWCGRPLIAIHNHTDNDINIKVNDPFVIMILEYLHTPSSIKVDSTKTSRLDILHNYQLSDEEHNIIYQNDIHNPSDLKTLTKKNKAYNVIKESEEKSINTALFVQALIIAFLVVAIILLLPLSKNGGSSWYLIPSLFATAMVTNFIKFIFDKK